MSKNINLENDKGEKTMKANNETCFELSGEFYNFTVVQNYILEDERVTDNAIGLYMRIIKFQNSREHKIYLSGLITETNKRGKVTNAMNELMQYGYITRESLRGERGRFTGYKYTVYSKPVNPCATSVPTECNSTASGQTEIRQTTTKKENVLKKKITKKENKISQQPREEETPSINLSLVEKNLSKLSAYLTDKQKQTINTWDYERLVKAVQNNSQTYKHLKMCYDNPIEIPATAPAKKKGSLNNMGDNEREWDFEKLDMGDI